MELKKLLLKSKVVSRIRQIRHARNQFQTSQYNSKLNGKDMYHSLCEWYKERTGRVLDLSDPKTYDEKIQWSKIYASTPLKTRLADKYLVKDYARERIGEEHLNRLLGVWESFDEIDFDSLPNRFVLKATHGCKWNIIVPNKAKFNKAHARKLFSYWMKTNYAFVYGFELHYRDIRPRIIAEEYLETKTGELPDYKISCFGGKPYVIQYLSDRNMGTTIAAYDPEWNRIDLRFGHPSKDVTIPRPEKLDELLWAASSLSEGFNFVRVDFYILDDGSIRFGEMTFTPSSGVHRWFSDENYDSIMGDMFLLPEKYYLPGIIYDFLPENNS